MGRSWFVAMFWLSPASASGVHSRRSSVVATLRSCRRGCVPRGRRAPLDADMLELIDRSACLVEPIVVESCAPPLVLVLFLAASTSSAASGRCSRIPPPRGLVEGLLLPESSLLADRDLSPVVHVSLCSLTYFCMYSILGHILRVSTPSQPSVLIQSACALSMACAPSVSCETTAACFISSSTSGCSSSDTLCNVHHVRVLFHHCSVDCGRQGKCIHASFNVRLNSCCRLFAGSLSRLQAASSAVLSGTIFITQAYHHDSHWTCLSATTLRTRRYECRQTSGPTCSSCSQIHEYHR